MRRGQRAAAAVLAGLWLSACAGGGAGGVIAKRAPAAAADSARGVAGRGSAPAAPVAVDSAGRVEAAAAALPAGAPERRDGARTFVYVCGAATAVDAAAADTAAALTFTARIEGETAWLFLPGQTVSLPHVVSASGARYSDGETLLWPKGEEALLEWRGARYTGCRNDRRAAVWEHAKLNGVDFRAVGQEPGWHLEIRRADSLVLVSDYGAARFAFPWAEPVVDERGGATTYYSRRGEDELRVRLELLPCRDTMDGEKFETTVTVWINGRQLRGCGRPLH